LFASFISFTFSNNLGFALMSGSSVRYWIYTGFGLHPVEIGEVVAFCTLTVNRRSNLTPDRRPILALTQF